MTGLCSRPQLGRQGGWGGGIGAGAHLFTCLVSALGLPELPHSVAALVGGASAENVLQGMWCRQHGCLTHLSSNIAQLLARSAGYK